MSRLDNGRWKRYLVLGTLLVVCPLFWTNLRSLFVHGEFASAETTRLHPRGAWSSRGTPTGSQTQDLLPEQPTLMDHVVPDAADELLSTEPLGHHPLQARDPNSTPCVCFEIIDPWGGLVQGASILLSKMRGEAVSEDVYRGVSGADGRATACIESGQALFLDVEGAGMMAVRRSIVATGGDTLLTVRIGPTVATWVFLVDADDCTGVAGGIVSAEPRLAGEMLGQNGEDEHVVADGAGRVLLDLLESQVYILQAYGPDHLAAQRLVRGGDQAVVMELQRGAVLRVTLSGSLGTPTGEVFGEDGGTRETGRWLEEEQVLEFRRLKSLRGTVVVDPGDGLPITTSQLTGEASVTLSVPVDLGSIEVSMDLGQWSSFRLEARRGPAHVAMATKEPGQFQTMRRLAPGQYDLWHHGGVIDAEHPTVDRHVTQVTVVAGHVSRLALDHPEEITYSRE